MKKIILIVCVFVGLKTFAQQSVTLKLDSENPGVSVAPTMWGLFFEDINFAADGGLYAQLVKNGSFQFDKPLMGWKEVKENAEGRILVNNRNSGAANTRFLGLEVDAPKGSFGLTNEGFRGMGIKAATEYKFSAVAHLKSGDLKMSVSIIDDKGKAVANITQQLSSNQSEYKISLTAGTTVENAMLKITFSGKGAVDLDNVSLFPKDTWGNRENGLRKDIVQLLHDLKPGFLRFPGGCIVEGRDLENRYEWKNTVGPVNDRKLILNRWNNEFGDRLTPDYFQSYGLGFYEYFLLSEDLGATPLPILNCGMACQFNTAEVVAMPELDSYIQDALDLIEFANGNELSKWGALRVKMGHPKPFNLKYIGIGNEQWGPQYIERYNAFHAVISKKYPEIKIVSTVGPFAEGENFEYAWSQLKETKPALVDEHYYRDPNWFFNNATRYDNYDRSAPKVFAGEYASHGYEDKEAESKNTWLSALSEAAFMTGLERNADVVQMASYAPLLAHKDAWQWRPDLIWFDNLKAVATPNYYVQKMYSAHKGDLTVPVTKLGKTLTGGADSLYASATFDKTKKSYFIKIVNSASTAKSIIFEDLELKIKGIELQTLVSENLKAYNSLNNPDAITPKSTIIKANKRLKIQLKPFSANLIIVQTK